MVDRVPAQEAHRLMRWKHISRTACRVVAAHHDHNCCFTIQVCMRGRADAHYFGIAQPCFFQHTLYVSHEPMGLTEWVLL